eukprot:1106196-Rhodomonas_salina.1
MACNPNARNYSLSTVMCQESSCLQIKYQKLHSKYKLCQQCTVPCNPSAEGMKNTHRLSYAYLLSVSATRTPVLRYCMVLPARAQRPHRARRLGTSQRYRPTPCLILTERIGTSLYAITLAHTQY